MTGEFTVLCKRCGKKFGYSERSYTNSIQYGLSRPEYCEDCQQAESDMRRGIGSPYFHVPHIIGELSSSLDSKHHSHPRNHQRIEREGNFDEALYGLTQDKVVEIADWFRDPNHRVVVVVGPTGSGKSTALPYWLVYPPVGIEPDFFTRDGQILVTQPRIVAVTGITKYLAADLMGSSIGAGYDIGYSYSKEDKSDWRNAIDLTTDGKLINAIVAGRISQYGLIIIDEAHERSENIETILRLLKDRMGLYPNLKLIIASATIDAEFFRQYFDAEGATIVEFEGKTRVDAHGNPVSYRVFFASEDERIPYDHTPSLGRAVLRSAESKAKWLVEEMTQGHKDQGDILIFLQGKRPIDILVEKLQAWANQDEKLADIVEVYPLYRDLEPENKDKVLACDPKPGKIRIIVSTNIAEASVTVDSVIYEIETGVEIQPQFNAEVHATEYPLVLISKANAKQRWGRTGRTRNGEVYCLYTEDQFNELFRDYPIAAIQRSSMENVILNAKAAGVPNVVDGWLENPPTPEIGRSVKELIDADILTENGTLTEYGVIARSFAYPPRLVDMIMRADDLGCAVELTTLLPVIKNDGLRRLLTWKFGWDAYTKRLAHQRHQALMAGCRDDVDFILKVYKAWDELPWLDHQQLGRLSETEMDSLRQQWAQLHFVNHKVLVAIREERNQVLERLMVHSKEGVRRINLDQVGLVRRFLASVLSGTEQRAATHPYQYHSAVELPAGTMLTCTLLPETAAISSQSWVTADDLHPTENNLFSKLFVDQVYPVGFRFKATVDHDDDGFAWVKTTRNLTRMQASAANHQLEDDDELDSDLDEFEDNQPVETPGVTLNDISVWYRSVNCSQIALTKQPIAGQEIVVEIIGYQFPADQVPVVVTKVIPQPEPFTVFSKRHRFGDVVSVEAIDLLEFPHDNTAILAAQEPETGLEVLIEPQDLSFTRSSYLIKSIQSGQPLALNVEHIDKELKRVRLSNWEAVEDEISQRFKDSEGNDDACIAQALVVEIKDNGTVLFAPDWNQPEKGLGVVVSSFKLPKAHSEFVEGERVVLKLVRHSKAMSHANLAKLPPKAVSQVGKDSTSEGLTWNRGVLRFKGRMTYNQLYKLKSIAEGPEFHKALEMLYWYSNRIHIAQFIDTQWHETITTEYEIGSVVGGVVVETNEHGAKIEIGSALYGFVPRSKLLGGFYDPRDVLPINFTVQAKVLEHRIDKGELLLEIADRSLDPLQRQIEIGQIYRGTVTGIKQYGIFVRIAPGIEGLVHYSRMYKSPRYKTEELYREGDQLIVRVNNVDLDKHRLELDMKIPENDPLTEMSVGQKVIGTVVNVTQHGAFVELNPAVDGLLRAKDFPTTGGLFGLGSPPKIEVGRRLEVRITAIDTNRRNVSLAFVKVVK